MAATASGKDKIMKYTRFFVGGYDLSGDSRNVGGLTNSFNEVDMTAWSNSVYNFMASKRLNAGITGYQAFMNDAAAGAFTQLKTAGTLSDIAVLFGGGGEPAVPDPAYILPSVQFGSNATFDGEAGVVETDFKVDATADISGFNNALGYTLANTLFTATASNASHDNGAATTNGFSAVIQVLDATGDFTFTIEESSDDGSGDAWATVATFTLDGTAVGSEFVTVTGAVERYIRFTATRTSGQNNVVCAYARGV
jgi:hypothetical protein